MSQRATMLFLVVMLTGCTGQGVLRDGDAVPDAGSPAAQIYIKRCGICHAVPHPARHSDSGWLLVVPLMEQRMAERGIRPLTDEERSAILRYLQAHAR